MTTSFLDMLAGAERANDSMLCVGLDPDPARFPEPLRGDPARIFDFCARVVDATRDLVIAYKPQIAYFAANRAEDQLERLIAYMHRSAPAVPVILDAKRGDMGSTAEQYARELFDRYGADAVTLSPFLGFDSIEPYLRHAGKGVILLCRTSNPGGADLREQRPEPASASIERIACLLRRRLNTTGQVGPVVAPPSPPRSPASASWRRGCLLIPGIGAQGAMPRRRCAGWRGSGDTTTARDHRQLIARRARSRLAPRAPISLLARATLRRRRAPSWRRPETLPCADRR
jgi:orotidine-5'-phosphate decarboxylase